MRSLPSMAALALALSVSVASGQSGGADEPEAQSEPATTQEMKADQSPREPETTQGLKADKPLQPDAGADGTAAPGERPVPGQIVLQDKNSFLASSLMDATVLAADPQEGEEEVGNVADVIISFDGSVAGVVIGVGGFLGIGEKKVAVELAALDLRISQDGKTMRIFLETGKDELMDAPAFKSVTHQYVERERERAQSEMLERSQRAEPAPSPQDGKQDSETAEDAQAQPAD